MTSLIYLAFFLPALTGILYFLSNKNKLSLFVLPVLFLVLSVIFKLDVNVFAAEEGNLLWYILAAVLLLILFDYLYKRPIRGFGFFSGFALLFFVLLNGILILAGVHV